MMWKAYSYDACKDGISMPTDGICGAAEAGTKYRLHDRTMNGSKGKS